MTRMTKDQIADFVNDVAATGCDITAIPGVGYVIGDADLSDDQYQAIAPELKKITERYGQRGHLLKEITDHLVSTGRSVPPLHTLADNPPKAGGKD